MAKYLTQEWLDVQRELAQEFPERPGPRPGCSTS